MRRVNAIPSKSDAHRALICNFLAHSTEPIFCDLDSKDILATKACLSALEQNKADLYPKESGSAFRFLLPICLALQKEVVFHLEGRLSQRPLSPLYEELLQKGAHLSAQGSADFHVGGTLQGGLYTLSGQVSSQFISGLLFALPLLQEDSQIQIVGPLESKPYIDMTIDTLQQFGIQIRTLADGYRIAGKQAYQRPKQYQIAGDWSNAAFFLAAGALCKDGIEVAGLSLKTKQGDQKILDYLKAFGATVEYQNDVVFVKGNALKGVCIDAAQVPDLVPALAVLGAFSKGETKIFNAHRLKLKESDRLVSIYEALSAIGADIQMTEDTLVLKGKTTCAGGKVNGQNDHRIVMMAAIASLRAQSPVTILGSQAVMKSYPHFFEDFTSCGWAGNIERK